MRSILPLINHQNQRSISQLIDVGFAYVKLPDVSIEKSLLSLHRAGIDFFNKSQEYKRQWLMNDKLEGYADREESKDPQSIKQFFFRPKNPIGDFRKDESIIKDVYKVFHDHIALNLLKNIFSQKRLSKVYAEASEKTFPSLSFAYYPEKLQMNCSEGLKAHRDFDMISVLWVTKPGLEIFYQNAWYDVDPKPGYVVVNLGNTLKIMLGGQCTSAQHRVRLVQEERLTIGLFVGPGEAIKDYTTNKVVYGSYKDYLDAQFKNFYEEPKKSSIITNGIFAKKQDQIDQSVAQYSLQK